MRITLVISSLGPGGAERVLSNMANHWSEQGQEVTLITLAGLGHDHYPLHRDVVRVTAGFFHTHSGFLDRFVRMVGRILHLRKVVQASRPDVVVSFIDTTNIRVLLAMFGASVPVIVSERANPMRWPLARIWHVLRRLLYSRATLVVVQTTGMEKWASKFLPSKVVRIIPNAIHLDVDRADGEGVIAVGRMHPQKGFDLLLKAWQQVHRLHPNAQLAIVGKGPLRSELEAMAQELGIARSVRFLGVLAEPYKIMQQHQIFVLASRYEGFPNVLLEAMACGLAPVGFDCDFGPRDIIRHRYDGLLVPPEDVDALGESLLRLVQDHALTKQLADNALEVKQRFAPEKIMALWDDLLVEAVRGK